MSKKVTKEIVNSKLADSNRDVRLLGEYKGAKVKTTFTHQICGNIWSTTPNTVLNGSGCPKCAKNIPLTVAEVNRRIKNRGLMLVADHITNNRTKTTVRHSCGYEWNTQPAVLLLGHGCPRCANRPHLTTHEISDRLFKKEIVMLGEYTNAHNKTLFKHTRCGYEWLSSPSTLLTGNGSCPKCAKYGFNPSLSGYGYVLVFDEFMKYGITNTLEQRLKQHARTGRFDVLGERLFLTGSQAKEWEDAVKTNFGGNYATKSQCPSGFTETLPAAMAPEVVSLLLLFN
jgi:hypothetical protein